MTHQFGAIQAPSLARVRAKLRREEVDEIIREIERYVANIIPMLPPEEAFYEIKGDPSTLKQLPRIDQHDEYFHRFHRHQRMSELATHLLGCAVVPRDPQWFNKPPQLGKATPAHQDGFYDKIEPIEMVNMWLALDPVDEQNGCVRYVASSHKRGLRKHARTNTLGFSQGLVDYGPEDRANEAAVCAAPGDMLVHHGLTIHRADGNAWRWACDAGVGVEDRPNSSLIANRKFDRRSARRRLCRNLALSRRSSSRRLVFLA